MYITRATINGLEETATYPMAVSVIQDIRNLIGLTPAVPIRIGDNPPLLLTKDTHGQNENIPDILDEELQVEYTETGGDGYDIALTSLTPTARYIYYDPDVRSYIKPILAKKTMTFTITYYAKSKSKVTSIINRLTSRNASDTRNRLHNLSYFYYIPEIVIELLGEINRLKNTHITPPVDLDVYLTNTFTTQANTVNSETGNQLKATLAIRELQQSVIGTIDTDTYSLQKDKDTDGNRWSITLDYSIEYEMPTSLVVSYPITVYNQPIPVKFRLDNTPKQVYAGNHTDGEEGLAKITTRAPALLGIRDTDYYLKIPFEDRLELPAPGAGYIRLFSVVSVVDPLTPTSLFYLDELPNIVFKPDVLALIKLEAARLGIAHTSLFYIDIFNYTDRLYSTKVVAKVVTELINGISTERVQLTTDTPLDIRGSYRISFNILTDLAVLKFGTLDLLKKNIKTVDASTLATFSVIDTVLTVFNLDISKLKSNFTITSATTSLDIALNISNTLWNRVYTKQTASVITGMLQSK